MCILDNFNSIWCVKKIIELSCCPLEKKLISLQRLSFEGSLWVIRVIRKCPLEEGQNRGFYPYLWNLSIEGEFLGPPLFTSQTTREFRI